MKAVGAGSAELLGQTMLQLLREIDAEGTAVAADVREQLEGMARHGRLFFFFLTVEGYGPTRQAASLVQSSHPKDLSVNPTSVAQADRRAGHEYIDGAVLESSLCEGPRCRQGLSFEI